MKIISGQPGPLDNKTKNNASGQSKHDQDKDKNVIMIQIKMSK